MKRLLLLSSALVLVVPDIAVAMQAQERPRPQRPGASQPQRPGASQPQRPPQQGGRPPATRPPQQGARPPATRPPQQGARPPAVRPPQQGGRPPVARPPHRPGQGRPPGFRPIQRPGWNYPRGWNYRRWRAGLILPTLFWSSRYFFSDYGLLGLGAPPRGYMWIRYGPDLLLVRRSDRRIVDVIYGAFF